VAGELGRHLQDGRLDAAEFDERLGQAMTARTRGDLDRLLADLPRPLPERLPAAGGAGWPRTGRPFPLVPIALAVLVVTVAGAGGAVWALLGLWCLAPIAILTARGRWARGAGAHGDG
jgi:hypothetical protein